jgi:hypothetical protein
MKRLKKQGELTPYVGDDLVRVGGHQATRVHEHAVELRCVTEAIPIGLLHLPGFVRVKDEVAARRAPGQRPDHAGLDDASSGHAGSTSEKHAGGAAGNCPPLARNALTGRQEPSAAASPRHHNESTDDSLRVGQHGSDLCLDLCS